MTQDSDFKKLVRARMSATGENYTTARAALEARDAALAEHARVIGPFFDGERLRSVPTRRKVRVSVLLELLSRFEPGRAYPEPEVNALLGAAHEDHAYLRRELVNYGYLTRSEGIYRTAEKAPERDIFFANELPAWERVWLPTFLAGATHDGA